MTNKKERTWTDEEWTTATQPLNEWMKNNKGNEEAEFSFDALKSNIKRGIKFPARREKSWTAMLLEMREYKDSPIGGKGAASLLPQFVQDNLKIIEPALIAERTPSFGEYTALVSFTRKTTGEGDNKTTIRTFFENANGEAKAWAKGRISALKKAFNADEWDGTLEGLRLMANVHPNNIPKEEVAENDS